jgi:hypothetical protein
MGKFLLLLSILPLSALSQNVLNMPIDSATGLITYKKIIPVNGNQKMNYLYRQKNGLMIFIKIPKLYLMLRIRMQVLSF